jgi:SAM-dependent methyltransferase
MALMLYHQWARALSDEAWSEFLAGTPIDGHIPPPLPPEDFQRAWTGNAGMREAVAFCRLLKDTLASAGYNLNPHSRALEIGVGWGRVYRALLRETPQIIGVDPVARCIELCRQALPSGHFEMIPPEPPYRFADHSFDLVYLYSVFSHLNEPQFLAVLRDAARVVRPGGFIVFTTLSPTPAVMQQCGFPEAWQEEADAGRFLYVPTGGGELMPAEVWGWVHLSPPYLQRVLADFPLRLLAYQPARIKQAFAVVQRDGGSA